MNKILQFVGQLVFWAGWPFIYMVVQGSQRTRIVVVVDGQVLVIKSWLGNGYWGLPGGGIKRRETAPTAAARELREEIGLVVPPEQLQHFDSRLLRENGLSYQMECFSLVLPSKPDLHLQRLEIAEVNWLPLSEIGTEPTELSLQTGVTTWLKLHNLV